MTLKRPMKYLTNLLITTIATLTLVNFANAGSNALCESDIKAVIKSYEKALNGSDIKEVVKLYAQDGVFMPSTKPTSTGHTQVASAYQYVFKALDLNVTFHFDEIVRKGDLAFVRTSSDGKIKLLQKNKTIENHSRELFIMKRIKGNWKIYRYMFNESG
ncbi:hypothetical protein MNBD_GAMMA23-764 [hydrothermal vent metagenome]|uniref:DUF4440 domain-containing protein n=1 Tax=hydrothermal vent metagenome TaxID=652676 RepID=A0A3B1A2A8_9ZZZZ